MDMDAAVRARLLAAGPVTALVASYTPTGGSPAKSIFWEDRPQSSPLPAIVLHNISDPRPQHLQGFIGTRETRVQVNSLALVRSVMRQLNEAAIAALVPEQTGNGISFLRAMVDNSHPISTRTETQFIYGISTDLIFFWSEG